MIEPDKTRISAKNKKTNIILASNNRLFRDGIAKILKEDKDIEIVSELSNALEVIRGCQEYLFDILLISVNLEGLNLKRILKMVKKKNRGKVLLFIDRQYDEDELVDAISLGLRGYLLRDSNSKQLKEAIDAVSEGQFWIERKIAGKVFDAFLYRRKNRRGSRTGTLYDLTDTELNIVKMVVSGYSNKTIASHMYISEKTVKFHLYKVFKKLSIKSRSQLILHCFRSGMLN
ncbi:MAG TPA: response regulator transcription factor [Thermodesulfobacteriota bacterium]